MDQLILTGREALWWCSATHVIYLTAPANILFPKFLF